MTSDRIAIFIDGTNLTKGLKELYAIERINVELLCNHLANGREIVGIYYAEAPYIQNRGINNFSQQQKYFNEIKKIKGLIFRKGKYSTYSTPPVEKLTDVYLAVDMADLCLKDKFDIAFIVSGDSDLSPAVDVLVREGKRVVIVYFDTAQRSAYALRKHGGGFFVNITKSLAQKFQWPNPTTSTQLTLEDIKKEPGP